MDNSSGSPQGRSPLFCLYLTVESPSGNLLISHKVLSSFRITFVVVSAGVLGVFHFLPSPFHLSLWMHSQ